MGLLPLGPLRSLQGSLVCPCPLGRGLGRPGAGRLGCCPEVLLLRGGPCLGVSGSRWRRPALAGGVPPPASGVSSTKDPESRAFAEGAGFSREKHRTPVKFEFQINSFLAYVCPEYCVGHTYMRSCSQSPASLGSPACPTWQAVPRPCQESGGVKAWLQLWAS